MNHRFLAVCRVGGALGLVLSLAFSLSPLGFTQELTPEEEQRAAELLRALAADVEAERDLDAAKRERLSRARSQLQAVEVALLEARAWLDRESPAEAGKVFVEAGTILAEIDEELHPLLQPRLRQAEQARLQLARRLLNHEYLQPQREEVAAEEADGAPEAPSADLAEVTEAPVLVPDEEALGPGLEIEGESAADGDAATDP
ncbi:MAG: hypothetical protein EA402_07005 [Planctomycetota bacterium]|nr:MAG: hypothetical protein EA402_07005 [Planctomycetota bacterium]